jgi:predicted nucleic acid-binding protein
MRVFLDTNIILDALTQRQPHAVDSQAVLDRCSAKGHEVFIAVHGLATAFYILESMSDAAMARQALADFLLHADVAAITDNDVRRAFTLGFTDFEDALQVVAAEACAANCIVTRNVPDFAKSPTPALMPAEFLSRYP